MKEIPTEDTTVNKLCNKLKPQVALFKIFRPHHKRKQNLGAFWMFHVVSGWASARTTSEDGWIYADTRNINFFRYIVIQVRTFFGMQSISPQVFLLNIACRKVLQLFFLVLAEYALDSQQPVEFREPDRRVRFISSPMINTSHISGAGLYPLAVTQAPNAAKFYFITTAAVKNTV